MGPKAILHKLRLPIIIALLASTFIFFNQIVYAATFVLNDANIYPQSSQAFRVVATDEQAFIGTGSWQATGLTSTVPFQGTDEKAGIDVFPGQYGLPASFTLSDIDSIEWSTFQTTYGTTPVDWYVTIYLSVPGESFSYARLTGEGIFVYNRNVLDGQWNTYTTLGDPATTENLIGFYNSSAPGSTNIGFFNAPTLADLQAGTLDWGTYAGSGSTNSFNYSNQPVNFIRFETGNPWDAGFEGFIDRVRVVVNGTEALLDLEPSANDIVVTKDFPPAVIDEGNVSVVNFTLFNNTGTDQFDITLEDSFPTNLGVVASTGSIGSCGGGSITEIIANNSVRITDVDLAAGETCNFSVTVTGSAAGTYVNDETNIVEFTGEPAFDGAPRVNLDTPAFAANLTVVSDSSLTFGKTFNSDQAVVGTVSTLTLFISNFSGTAVAGGTFTDDVPAPLTVLSTNAIDCGGSANVTNTGNLISAAGIDVADGTTCRIVVDVICSAAGTANNTTSALTDAGGTLAPAAADTINCVAPPNTALLTGGDDDDDGEDDNDPDGDPAALPVVPESTEILPSLPQVDETPTVEPGLPPSLPNTGGGPPPSNTSLWGVVGLIVAVLTGGFALKARKRQAD